MFLIYHVLEYFAKFQGSVVLHDFYSSTYGYLSIGGRDCHPSPYKHKVSPRIILIFIGHLTATPAIAERE